MRILHIVDSLHPGGMENGVVNVARWLTGRVDTHVACLKDRGAFANRLPEPEQAFVLGKGHHFSLSSVQQLHRAIRRLQPDLVHTHNLGPLIYASLATAFGAVTPIVHGEHGQIQEQERNVRRRLQRRLLYRFCRGLHTVSRSMVKALQAEGLPVRRMTAIVNGVDAEHFCPPVSKESARAAAGLPADALVAGIVGRFVALKRHHLLLRAFGAVAPSLPSLRLLIVGDGGGDADADAVRAAIESHPQRARIHWVGMQSDTRPWYQAMDLLVAPSVIEGLSNVVLEAMACGVPVLAHCACGNSEVILHEQNGYCDELGEVEGLAASMRKRFAKPEVLRRAGAAAQQHVAQHFSLERMACGYQRFYEACARRPLPVTS